MEGLAKKIISRFKAVSDGTEALIICLSGNLGAGKTTLTQFLAKHLGVKSRVTSPTFVILKSYKLTAKSYKLMYHIDAYRLKSGRELIDLGWLEIVKNPSNLIVIEWPENIKEILPKDAIRISLEVINKNSRKIKIIWPRKSKR